MPTVISHGEAPKPLGLDPIANRLDEDNVAEMDCRRADDRGRTGTRAGGLTGAAVIGYKLLLAQSPKQNRLTQ